ncbi:MAG: phosphonate degradation HD-domain oxygenase [Saprospiraceae bacterium]
MQPIVSEIITLFNEKGGSMYGGEAVTQLEHALQGATLARTQGAPSSLVVAALLHDIGHLLHDLPQDAPDEGVDDVHENLAAQFLAAHFIPDVIEPVRLHVEAKRYLCATENGYLQLLSAPSIQSLALQGGPMHKDEVADFEQLPFYKQAVQLRIWDDQAKDPSIRTAPIESFADDIAAALLS